LQTSGSKPTTTTTIKKHHKRDWIELVLDIVRSCSDAPRSRVRIQLGMGMSTEMLRVYLDGIVLSNGLVKSVKTVENDGRRSGYKGGRKPYFVKPKYNQKMYSTTAKGMLLLELDEKMKELLLS
jgi:predicted transcriptional regulator